MDRIADIESGNVHRYEIRQIARQTLDFQRTEILVQQTAKCLDPLGNAGRDERDIGLDHLIHRDSVKIDMQNVATERRVLHLLQQSEAAGLLAVDLELDQNVFARSVTEHERNISLGNLQRLGLGLAAVNDRWDCALRFDFADSRSTSAGAPRCREFYLFRHGFGFLVRAAVDLKKRRNRFVTVDPLDAFPEKLRDAKHRGGKTFHGANGHAVGRY